MIYTRIKWLTRPVQQPLQNTSICIQLWSQRRVYTFTKNVYLKGNLRDNPLALFSRVSVFSGGRDHHHRLNFSQVRQSLLNAKTIDEVRYLNPDIGTSQASAASPQADHNRDTTLEVPPSVKSLVDDMLSELKLPKTLREYQMECLLHVMTISRTCNRIGVSLATGSGKTLVMLLLLYAQRYALQHNTLDSSQTTADGNSRKKLLLVAPSQETRDQAFIQAKELFPDLVIDVEKGGVKADPANADLIITTYRALHNRLDNYDPTKFVAIACDEVHHAVSSTYMKIWEHFDCLHSNTEVRFLGVTATMNRHDKLPLDKIMDSIVYHRGIDDLIKQEHLCDLRITQISTDEDFQDCYSNVTQRLNTKAIEKIMDTPERNSLLYKTWKHNLYDEGYKSTLIFACNVNHSVNIAHYFRSQGVDARVVTGKTPTLEREKLLSGFNNAEYPVLVNCQLITEGVNLERTDSIVLAKLTRSKLLLTQMIGRGLRKFPGKKDCHVIDMIGTLKEADGLVLFPSLSGEKRMITKELTDEQLLEEEIEDNQRNLPNPSKKTISKIGMESWESFAEYLRELMSSESRKHLTNDGSDGYGDFPSVYELSSHNWLAKGDGSFVLFGGDGYLQISLTDEGKYAVVRTLSYKTKDGKQTRYSLPTKHEMADLIDAVNYADKYAHSVYPNRLISSEALWRDKPITNKQASQIERIVQRKQKSKRIKMFDDMTLNMDKVRKLTRGEANDLLNLAITFQKISYLMPLLDKADIGPASI